MHDQDAPPEETARHLLTIEPTGLPWVLSVLRAAARTATVRGETDVAADYLRRALREPLTDDGRAIVLAELGHVVAGRHPAAAVRHLTESLSLLPGHAAQRGEVVTLLADALTRCRRGCQAVELLDREIRTLASEGASHPDPDLMAHLHLQRLLIDLEDPAKRPHAFKAADDFEARNPHDAAVRRGAAAVRASAALGQSTDAAAVAAHARRALEGDLPRGVMTTAAGQAVLAMTWCDQQKEAAAFVDRLSGDTQQNASSRILVTMSQSEFAYRSGDLHTAINLGRDCLNLFSSHRGDSRLALATATLIRALVESEQTDEAAELLALPDCTRLEPDWHWTHLLEARARLFLARGHLEDALQDLTECGRRQTAWHLDNPAVLPWRSLTAVTHLAMGEQRPAELLAQQEVEQARTFGAPRALGISLRAAGLAARGQHGQRLLGESVDLLDQAGAAVEQARSLVALATLRFEGGHTRMARDLARRGLRLAQHCGAAQLSSQALDRLRKFGARPRTSRVVGVHALTTSERRVAVLAARGLTNREIAEQLFITQRTVENHLTSGFRKLGITGRRQLPDKVRDLDARI
ncbi:helix-turn-helix transcriptional regulator [Streptomyces sp.]|uniref:helix-turn-helix transcriptional regulator n=1 Tax=Streptomyces sp. TaxID=1931 RepID=UPI002D78FE18|nr:LuxR C-terminal-related transcriptional regulator [Streptomyces sp.]HET6353900.1 LuxR C-terminal-related transcriptional regulator [Streptomyces sp.]